MNKNCKKTEKNKNFYKKVSSSGTVNCYSILKEENPFQNFFEEDFHMKEKTIAVNKFKKFIKISLKNHQINIYKKSKILEEKEFISDNPFFTEEKIYDDYSFLENQIVVMDFEMTIKNDLLYEVLNSMEQEHRDIAYLSLCEDWSDSQIGERLNISRQKVQRIKQKIKKEIYYVITGGTENEDKTQRKN